MILNGLYQVLSQSGATSSLIAACPGGKPGTAIYFTLAAKGSARPFVVISIIDAPPAEQSMDGSSALIESRIQFDSYADDQLTARALSKAIRLLLEDFDATLPDGTTAAFTGVNIDTDGPYEVGGAGYLFRNILDLSAFYQEQVNTVQSYPPRLYSLIGTQDGTNVNFTLPTAVVDATTLMLYLNGQMLIAPDQYSLSGGINITFVQAPASGDVVRAWF